MKKRMALLAALLLSVSICACGKDEEVNTTQETEVVEDDAQKTEEEEKSAAEIKQEVIKEKIEMRKQSGGLFNKEK